MSDVQEISSITQIRGVVAGHATLPEGGSGCTVIVCPDGAVGGVDVRGGAPATRETDLMRPEETVQTIDAVVLSGGSAFGLAASVGVAEELERRGIGVDVGVGVVPIVVGACLFDLGCGRADVRPRSTDGVSAACAAFENAGKPLARGNVGAGCGCSVGKVCGPARAMKSGFGEDVEQVGELICGAVAAVNALGDVIDPDSGHAIAGLLAPDGHSLTSTVEFVVQTQAHSRFAREHVNTTSEHASTVQAAVSAKTRVTGSNPRTNTTISCVVTNARLTKAGATKVAQMASDAYAHAIRPTHTSNDGDTVFVMATGEIEVPIDVVGIVATRALERAIVDAVRQARSAYGLLAACDL